MSEDRAESIPPLAPLPRRFVRHVLTFFVGLGIGLAPFLGNRNVPGFKALISLMPFQIASELITLSAFVMGFIVLAIQFYSGERIPRSVVRRFFGISLAALAVGFVLFYHLRNEYTVDVERGRSDDRVTVLISSAARKQCQCKDPDQNPEQCIQELSFSAPAIASCWDRKEIRRRGGLLGLSYLILTGGVGVLIGFLMLQEKLRREERKRGTGTTRPAASRAPKKASAASVAGKAARPAAQRRKPSKAAPAPGPEEPTLPE